MKKLLFSAVAVLALSGMVMGASFAVPALTEVEAGNTVNIQISAVGSAALQGVNLYLQVGAPLEISGVSFDAGTIFNGNHNPPSPYDLMGNMAAASTTTSAGTVAAPGVVAVMTVVVPAGTAKGDYAVQTFIPDFGVGSDFVGSAATTDGQGAGIIRVVPEPATALLLLSALPFLRRRHA